MNLVKSIFTHLPEKTQVAVVEAKCKDGSIFKMPVFKMLLHSLEFFGADVREIREAFTAPENKARALVDIFRVLGERARGAGERAEKESKKENARRHYHRAAIYYLCADWFTYDRDVIARNYQLMIPCYDTFRSLSRPPIEKIEFPFSPGKLMAHFRVPEKGEGRVPAVVIIQGNDEVKEFNDRFEEIALERGMAVLDLDPPGWGESGVTGNRCRSLVDYRKAIGLAVDFLQKQPRIDPGAVGVFGISFGGLLSPYAAGLEPRLAAAVGLGGPCFNSLKRFRKVRKSLPALQGKRSLLYTGAGSEQELLRWAAGMEFQRVMSSVRCPVLLVHGEKNELVNPSDAYENAETLGSGATVRIIPGGDHACTHALEKEVGPYMFDWLEKTLSRKATR